MELREGARQRHMATTLEYQEAAPSSLTQQTHPLCRFCQKKFVYTKGSVLAGCSMDKKRHEHLYVLNCSRGAISILSSAMRSPRLWERGCGEHGKMWRNVIPGQCGARISALPLGIRPQAVCFCRDTLNCPCTYVNIEHKDTHTLAAQ